VKDDAVAPVVAAMLILAVVVTFFAAWNAYYVPSMKAQSEIAHIKDVETGFLRFSSDIGTAASLKKNMRLSEPIPMGGGDFMFDPVKSGGELKIWNASPSGYLRLNWTSEINPDPRDRYFGLVKFTYKPVKNFWQDQGYGWSYGNVYVLNTERNLSTPLQFYSMTDVTYGLAGSLVDLEALPSPSSPGNCSSITIHVVNITPDSRHSRVTGNGNGMLLLESTVNTVRFINATSMNIGLSSALPEGVRATVWDSMNTSVDESLDQCLNIQRGSPPDPDQHEIPLAFNTYPYPNMTLVLETTEITVGAE